MEQLKSISYVLATPLTILCLWHWATRVNFRLKKPLIYYQIGQSNQAVMFAMPTCIVINIAGQFASTDWLKMLLTFLCLLTFYLFAVQTYVNEEDFWQKKRNRFVAMIFCSLGFFSLLMLGFSIAPITVVTAALIFHRHRLTEAAKVQQNLVDIQSLRLKLLKSSAELHNERLFAIKSRRRNARIMEERVKEAG